MSHAAELLSPSGLRAEINANGSLRRLSCEPVCLSLFIGNELEDAPANLYLRRRSGASAFTPLLGPCSPTRPLGAPGAWAATGRWQGVRYRLALLLAQQAPAWFWHLELTNTTQEELELDLTYTQDLALAPYGAVRLNEFYVSQYIDHTALRHPERGWLLASRQNQAVDGRYPWSLIGALRRGASFATDALQFYGLAARSGEAPAGLVAELADTRLQHEHSLAVVRDAPLHLAAGEQAHAGFFGRYLADHPLASSAADLEHLGEVLGLAEARPEQAAAVFAQSPAAPQSRNAERAMPAASPEHIAQAHPHATLFSTAPLLQALPLDERALRERFPPPWRHEEREARAGLLSFFHGSHQHVVLAAKEQQVLRPHGQLLRTGEHLTPDETSLTSTVWMGGVFHSLLTQGHVSINRLLSTVHSYLSLFRSHGQRVFVELGGRWRLLALPSAFEMSSQRCRWLYRHSGGLIEVRAEAHAQPHELRLLLAVLEGEPVRFLISHHIAINGDDGSAPGALRWARQGESLTLRPQPGSELGMRFPAGSFTLAALEGTRFEQVGTDELLFLDGESRGQPYLCLLTSKVPSLGLGIRGELITKSTPEPLQLPAGRALVPGLALGALGGPLGKPLLQLADIVPWLTHDALVHYLAPRGLEQYSGGGWGTRDVCQGPVEMLLALGHLAPIRDLLLRVMRQQNPDGDWPQWFMFFERERAIRPGDSHGDIVFWPLLVLAQYLSASGDAGVLEERVPFFDARGPEAAEQASLWAHVERALEISEKRLIAGTALAAYGHGDWNDSLQPADPHLREHLCSAWTVTLHHQTLRELAAALQGIGREQPAARLLESAQRVRRDFQRLLLADGVLTGYALFDADNVRYLLHPRDATTGVHFSSLAMVHAILEDLLSPEQTRAHLELIEEHLLGPDGLRLFDRPMTYHGGPQRLFQRAESATFFGREIGLMYMHAHLRYAQALAHVGEAQRFFRALCLANPIGIRALAPSARTRQASCYYSSSDAAFADRYEASAHYERIASGEVALEGGWRVYSSGAGIALGLILRRLLGVSWESQGLAIDPVMPAQLDGLRLARELYGRRIELCYRVGARGCGVEALVLDGQPLPFARAANPHRPGAARLAREVLLERLPAGAARSTLEVRLG
ncbi:MAG TPA: hypothetical protein VME21_13425 [Steroidobacteraceae bacterium]|nr:hypothetical protein [Steroidobacteraceae bacterium]